MTSPLDDLTPYDRLLYEIGLVAQTHVVLDNTLRNIHQSLTVPSAGVFLSSTIESTDRLISDCLLMTAKSGLSDEITAAAQAALADARAANQERNRVVHDWWMQFVDDPSEQSSTFELHRRAKNSLNGYNVTVRDLDSVRKVTTVLHRSHIRLSSLNWILRSELPYFKASGMPPLMPLEELLRVVQDKFEITDDGGYRPIVG